MHEAFIHHLGAENAQGTSPREGIAGEHSRGRDSSAQHEQKQLSGVGGSIVRVLWILVEKNPVSERPIEEAGEFWVAVIPVGVQDGSLWGCAQRQPC